jgi:hypothetical protein
MLEAGKIALEAGTQIVQHAHFRLALKMFDEVAADKARAAGDQDSHSKIFNHGWTPMDTDKKGTDTNFAN